MVGLTRTPAQFMSRSTELWSCWPNKASPFVRQVNQPAQLSQTKRAPNSEAAAPQFEVFIEPRRDSPLGCPAEAKRGGRSTKLEARRSDAGSVPNARHCRMAASNDQRHHVAAS